MTMRKVADILGLVIFIAGFGSLFFSCLGVAVGVESGIFFWLGAVLMIFGLAISRSATRKDCPHCGERIKFKAMKCKHCGTDISTHTNAPEVAH